MSTVIDVAQGNCADIEVGVSSESISVEVGNCYDIGVDIASGYAAETFMLERFVSQTYIGSIINTGTYTGTWNPEAEREASGLGGELKYIIVTVTNPGREAVLDLVPTIPGSGVTLTLAESLDDPGAPFNYTAAGIRTWYYIGSVPSGNLTIQAVNNLATSTDGHRVHFYAGTAFGNVAYLDSASLGGSASGVTLTLNVNSGTYTQLPFAHGATGDGRPATLGDWGTMSDDGTWSSYGLSYYFSGGGSYRPTYLDHRYKGAKSYVVDQYGGAMSVIVMTDDADAFAATGVSESPVSITAGLGTCSDIEVVVERGSC